MLAACVSYRLACENVCITQAEAILCTFDRQEAAQNLLPARQTEPGPAPERVEGELPLNPVVAAIGIFARKYVCTYERYFDALF